MLFRTAEVTTTTICQLKSRQVIETYSHAHGCNQSLVWYIKKKFLKAKNLFNSFCIYLKFLKQFLPLLLKNWDCAFYLITFFCLLYFYMFFLCFSVSVIISLSIWLALSYSVNYFAPKLLTNCSCLYRDLKNNSLSNLFYLRISPASCFHNSLCLPICGI